MVLEERLEFNKSAYFCFVDLTKVFDRINLNYIINILREYHVP